MDVGILVGQGEREHALARELGRRVADSGRVAEVGEALAEALEDPATLLDFAEAEQTAVRGDGAAVEGGGREAPVWGSGREAAQVTHWQRPRWRAVWCRTASQPPHSASSASLKPAVVMDPHRVCARRLAWGCLRAPVSCASVHPPPLHGDPQGRLRPVSLLTSGPMLGDPARGPALHERIEEGGDAVAAAAAPGKHTARPPRRSARISRRPSPTRPPGGRRCESGGPCPLRSSVGAGSATRRA